MSEGRAGRVLVVDDNPPTRYSTGRVLRAADFHVLEAGTGHEALVISAQLPDVVILDVNLPDIDGFEVCRRLRANPLTARTPVIHLSATFVNADAKVQGLEAGADGYLTHPVEPPVLIATVNAFLRARRAEEAMRSSEAKFKAVFDNAVNGIALLTEGMQYMEVNAAVAETLGVPQSAIVGRHISAFVPAEHESVLGAIDAALNATGSWRGAFPVVRPDGTLVELEWSVSIHSGPATTRLAVTTDVSERKAHEAERERLLASERAARTEAERANQLKDEFLAAVSHELRTPLNAILGWTRLIQMQTARPETGRGLEAIERNVRMQTQMIADLLDVSRITTGKLDLELESFEPPLVLEASLTGPLAAAAAKEVTVITRIDPSLTSLVWDLARFQQVVVNLADNAVKFSPRGGQVTISLSGDNDTTVLVVEDDGKGIAPEFLPHVFERFRQEDSGSRRRHGGLGLGLAIVKQLVEAHGGTISAASGGEGRGATFTVCLPRLTPARVAEASTNQLRTLTGHRILVVEDDRDALELIARVLGDAQAEIVCVQDVGAARNALLTFHPHLVVSDISMPGEDGFDLIRFMRRPDSEWAAVPAIALTAFARPEDRERIIAAGYQRHLTKPLDTVRLLEAVIGLVQPSS